MMEAGGFASNKRKTLRLETREMRLTDTSDRFVLLQYLKSWEQF